jgi:hypothetical protein
MSYPKQYFNDIYMMSYKEIRDKFLFLGEGISRKVYAINEDYVVKIAKGEEGLYQNKVERYVFTHCGKYYRRYLCPILYFKEDMLIMPRATPLSSLTSEKYLDIKKIRKEKNTYKDLSFLTSRFYLFYEDIISVSSWGILKGTPVLIDYGCTSERGDRYYDLKR